MKKLLFIFLIPIFTFTQNGDTNGDGTVNLVDLFNVLDNWLIEYPDSIATLEDFSNLLDSIQTEFENIGANTNWHNILFPEGYYGVPINHDLAIENNYVVPEGKNLYITNLYADGDELRIDDVIVNGGHINFGEARGHNPFILTSNQNFSCDGCANASFHGFLIEKTFNIEPITHDVGNANDYIVPEGKNLYITNLYTNATDFKIDDVIVSGGYINFGEARGHNPFILSPNQIFSCEDGYQGVASFNGYLVDDDYFSSASNSISNNDSSSDSNPSNNITNNSTEVSETDPISFNMGYDDFFYTVPENKNLVITSCFFTENWPNYMEIKLNGSLIFQGDSPMHQPLYTSAGDDISGKGNFNGYLIPLQYSTIYIDLNEESYTVPEGKKLILTHKFGTGYYYSNGNTYAGAFLLVDDSFLLYGFENPIEKSLYFNSGQTLTGTIKISGYLIDE